MPKVNVYFYESHETDVSISLDRDLIEEIFDDYLDGACPICRTAQINEGMIVCCGCAEDIVVAHLNMGESCDSPTIREMSRRK